MARAATNCATKPRWATPDRHETKSVNDFDILRKMTKTPELLDNLLRAGAPSGYEGPAAAVWREAASFAELSSDGIGSSIARVGDASPLMAVVGHIDEIGLIVVHIDEKGFLWFAPVGGWDPQILVGQRVEVRGKDGPVLGVVGRKPIHLLEPDQRKKVVELKGLHIDIGAADREEAQELIRVGDPAVIAAEPMPVAGDRLVSRAMDNRLGAYVALESLRRSHASGEMHGSFAAVAAVQEEIGLFGARTAAFELRPDLAIAVDVTHATDAPGVDEKEIGSHPLGSGPVIGRGSTLSPKVFELLVETAEAEGIEYSISASGRGTSTDADVLQISRAGIPTGLVSIPLRYMHSPVEMVDLTDVEATVELLVAFAARLQADVDLSR
jgi:putative aminopeptidase FrvX